MWIRLSTNFVGYPSLKSTKSPFKVYLNKTLPMIENLSHYWDKADGKTKKKILGCTKVRVINSSFFWPLK